MTPYLDFRRAKGGFYTITRRHFAMLGNDAAFKKAEEEEENKEAIDIAYGQ